MRATVEQIWPQANQPLEGRCGWMYVDRRGLVTTAVGVLIEPIELALNLDWEIGGRRASLIEIKDAWQMVRDAGVAEKNLRGTLKHWTAEKQEPLTALRLSEEAIDRLVLRRLRANVGYLRKIFSGWDALSGDAQLAALLLAWAIGAGFDQTRPLFVKAVRALDFREAAKHAMLSTHNNPGVVPRNTQISLCLENAAIAHERGDDPALLWWPYSAKRSPSEDARLAALDALDLGDGPDLATHKKA